MTQMILLVEHQGMIQLLSSPSNILWISHLVGISAENCDGELDERHVIVWRRILTVFDKILLLAVVKSLEALFLSLDKLSIMHIVANAAACWHL